MNNYVYIKPSDKLWEVAKNIRTPCVIYDKNQLENTLREVKKDIELIEGGKLNFAMKACYNKNILKIIADAGLGCDVASREEYLLAKSIGFSYITTTSPVYSCEDMKFFDKEGIILDLDSAEQIEQYLNIIGKGRIGLRVRIPIPVAMENKGTFGLDSRFGIDILNQKNIDLIQKSGLKVCRLHTHTGQMTPQILEFKVKYLLSIAEYFSDITSIDLGGGFFHLYRNREEMYNLIKKINRKVNEWKLKTGRDIKIEFEPGGAIVTPCGYLITQIESVKDNLMKDMTDVKVVTVNSSAWNIAPWHIPEVVKLGNDTGKFDKVVIAGNSLYELDFFGNVINGKYSIFKIPEPKYGDLLIISMMGGYTFTNARNFNLLEMPGEIVI